MDLALLYQRGVGVRPKPQDLATSSGKKDDYMVTAEYLHANEKWILQVLSEKLCL